MTTLTFGNIPANMADTEYFGYGSYFPDPDPTVVFYLGPPGTSRLVATDRYTGAIVVAYGDFDTSSEAAFNASVVNRILQQTSSFQLLYDWSGLTTTVGEILTLDTWTLGQRLMAGADAVSGGSGDDVLGGGGGNDVINGDGGQDAALYTGKKGGYLIATNTAGAISILDTRGNVPGSDGLDSLYGIERLRFVDGEFLFTFPAPLEEPFVRVEGTSGADAMRMTDGDQRLVGLGGNDLLEGGNGLDEAVFSGSRAQYSFMSWQGRTAVADLRHIDGVDTVSGIERLSYSDGVRAPETGDTPLEYIASYADLSNWLRTNAQGGFDHYVGYGYDERRTVSFDGLEYVASYADLMAWLGPNGDGGASHYITNGRFEGRTARFDGLEYIASYTDLMAWLGANSDGGATHYIQAGYAEGRAPSFDGLEYIASYADLMTKLGADAEAGARHYIELGASESRTTTFDGLRYIASYADLIVWLGADSDAGSTHYIDHGYAEGRTVDFDPAAYLANYADLSAWLGTDYEAATVHFIQYGYFEGRTD